MANKNKEVLYGLYDDEEQLLKAVDEANDRHLNIWDVFSPFPIHGLDEKLGLSESRLHIAGFVFGAIGTLTAFLFMTWVFTSDWPIIIGGKPFWSIPAFIPITFEFTVLLSAIGMTVAFYVVCGMGPGVVNPTLDNRISDDKFCLAFDLQGALPDEVDKLKSFLSDTGASEINSKTL